MTDYRQQLPLTETTFFILLSLAPERRHGYGIMKDVAELSDGRITFSTGTLYGALKRLLQNEWIVRVESPDDSTTGRIRKAYELTETGRRLLNAELERMQSLLATASVQLAGGHS